MTVQFKLDISQISKSRMDDFYKSIIYNVHSALNDPDYIKEFNEWKEKKKNES